MKTMTTCENDKVQIVNGKKYSQLVSRRKLELTSRLTDTAMLEIFNPTPSVNTNATRWGKRRKRENERERERERETEGRQERKRASYLRCHGLPQSYTQFSG